MTASWANVLAWLVDGGGPAGAAKAGAGVTATKYRLTEKGYGVWKNKGEGVASKLYLIGTHSLSLY